MPDARHACPYCCANTLTHSVGPTGKDRTRALLERAAVTTPDRYPEYRERIYLLLSEMPVEETGAEEDVPAEELTRRREAENEGEGR